MTTLTEAELADLEAKCEAATPGPWAAKRSLVTVPDANADPECLTLKSDPRAFCSLCEVDICSSAAVNDAAFIAASRTAVPRLIADLRASQTLLMAAVSALENLKPIVDAARAVEASFSRDEPLRLTASGDDAANRIVALRTALVGVPR